MTHLPYDLRRFSIVDGFQVLLHCCVIVLLRIQVVAELSKYDVLLRSV